MYKVRSTYSHKVKTYYEYKTSVVKLNNINIGIPI